MKKILLTTAALALLATFAAPAQAAISIGSATVVNGLASISGKGAVPGATITWEGSAVATANRRNGGFSFYGAVPADCTGTLGDGTESVEVAVVGCTPVGAGAPAPAAKTGQTTSQQSGDDGALQKGVATSGPRLTDNANGTVTDNLTGLIWLKQDNCFGNTSWSAALTAVSALANGTWTATRVQVHRSAGNPAANDPFNSLDSSRRSCRCPSLVGRPGAGRARSAWPPPPARAAAFQRHTLRRSAPRRCATSCGNRPSSSIAREGLNKSTDHPV
jgi:hypothetical protein